MTSDNNAYTRRLFLQQGLTLASMAATAPMWIEQSARGMMLPLGSMVSSQAGVPEDRILVVLQLGGGNDGLNTVIPYGASEYYNARPSLGIVEPGKGRGDRPAVLPVDQQLGIGVHPALSGFKELLDDGVASIVQGVGYPNPNRSHFTSMDIWHTANTSGKGTGWLGRYFDNTCAGRPEPDKSIAIGKEAPLSLIGDEHTPVAFESAAAFDWKGDDVHDELQKPYDDITRGGVLRDVDEDSQLGFLMRTTLDAQLSSDQIRRAVARPSLVKYPGGDLAHQFKMVGSMIRAEMPTRVYYVTMGGFDTHANQYANHAALLKRVGDALNAFYKDMKAQRNTKRVLTMVFSEFGRRVAQNGSGGTDHGCAAPMLLVGDMVQPGLRGSHPSLTDLTQGDLKYNLDFRSVYAGILEDWMGAPSAPILKGRYRKAQLFV